MGNASHSKETARTHRSSRGQRPLLIHGCDPRVGECPQIALSTTERDSRLLTRADARPTRVINCKSRFRAASADGVRPLPAGHVPMA